MQVFNPATYTQSVEVPRRCGCSAHTQHRVLRYKLANPSAKQKEIAQDLHLTLAGVKMALSRLKRRDLSRVCPECFGSRVLNGVCEECGCEPALPVLPLEVRFDQQSQTNSLHAGSELGSQVDYRGVGFVNHWTILKRRMESSLEDSLLRGVKSDVMQHLKEFYPSEAITDYAGKLCVKETVEFRARYPKLATSKNVRRQLAENVIRRLELLYGQFRRPPQVAEVTK